MLIFGILKSYLLLAGLVVASSATYRPDPYRSLRARQAGIGAFSNGTQVDLGYEVYQGYNNATSGLNIWAGIRFAAPPTGSLRWQAPQPPTSNRGSFIQASAFASFCPQSEDAPTTTSNDTGASEDCLFLNVYSPANATGPLPVFVWIHGGGYGAGNGRQDLSSLINSNNNTFVGVTIQYRLGAFGFLSSDEVFRNGVVNAGILDQHFALQWVQSYIGLFNGNASHVTIAGESAGGGSVMLQDMAYGGSLGTSLFTNTIAASPYLPMQYGYKDWIPSQSYYAFASAVGCPDTAAYGAVPQTIFQCLVTKDTTTLQTASAKISGSGNYGTWGFLPVTDGIFVQDLPSRQLLKKRINGKNALIGNNADEGALFVPQDIATESELVSWLQLTFPLFSTNDIAKILLYYPSSNSSATGIDYPTLGNVGPTALNQSAVATGQQARANTIYGETTFVCPSYWLAEAYTPAFGRAAYKYQFSVPVALHGTDGTGYFGPVPVNESPDFVRAFMAIFGRFVTTDNPSIPAAIATGASNASVAAVPNPASDWPPFSIYAPYQINLNESSTTNDTSIVTVGTRQNLSEPVEPGLVNDFTLVDAYTWEGGRGVRCDFWRAVGEIVPE